MLNILKKLRKSSDTFGLDIGTSAVKVVQLTNGSTPRVVGMASVGLPADTIADGSIRDSQTVADAIKEAVVKAGIEGTEAAIAVCGRELIIKKVQIPEVPAKEVHDVVMLEAEHHIPFAIDEVFIDHHTLGRSGGQMDVILVAVKKSKVNEYMAVVDQAGFNPLIVDVDGFALGNQWELNFPREADEAVALIDIGAAIMKTNVVRGGATIFARDIPFGATTTRRRSRSDSASPSNRPRTPSSARMSASSGRRWCRHWRRSRASCRWRCSGPSTTSPPRPSPSASARSCSRAAARSCLA